MHSLTRAQSPEDLACKHGEHQKVRKHWISPISTTWKSLHRSATRRTLKTIALLILVSAERVSTAVHIHPIESAWHTLLSHPHTRLVGRYRPPLGTSFVRQSQVLWGRAFLWGIDPASPPLAFASASMTSPKPAVSVRAARIRFPAMASIPPGQACFTRIVLRHIKRRIREETILRHPDTSGLPEPFLVPPSRVVDNVIAILEHVLVAFQVGHAADYDANTTSITTLQHSLASACRRMCFRNTQFKIRS
jgi:hypothetical protein